ncbi:DUF805 domain-containing protein [Nonlabens mediterrranea]|uniref:DUF805 domain-containing protein n=1 Tax=Nonlabens mediterrranea TaxID=1419947 RepID=A0ABS0A3J5_9FLAO|nr:DUF805 domain-containing protein [Nonlabens mediterrranea]
MMDAVKAVFNNYTDFSGRARRSEYWYWQLFNFIVAMIMYIPMIIGAATENEALAIPFAILLLIYGLATIIPSLAVIVRRLHDTGRSGWFYFISMIPFVGGIILLIWLIEDSKHGANQWGPNPKGIGNDDFNQNQF